MCSGRKWMQACLHPSWKRMGKEGKAPTSTKRETNDGPIVQPWLMELLDDRDLWTATKCCWIGAFYSICFPLAYPTFMQVIIAYESFPSFPYCYFYYLLFNQIFVHFIYSQFTPKAHLQKKTIDMFRRNKTPLLHIIMDTPSNPLLFCKNTKQTPYNYQ
jgi:hypothetical protein